MIRNTMDHDFKIKEHRVKNLFQKYHKISADTAHANTNCASQQTKHRNDYI